jgi:hypothetical protein
MGKETVFDGIVLRTVGRIMRNANFDPKLIGEALQVLFKEVVTGTVTPAPIAQHQDGGSAGIV